MSNYSIQTFDILALIIRECHPSTLPKWRVVNRRIYKFISNDKELIKKLVRYVYFVTMNKITYDEIEDIAGLTRGRYKIGSRIYYGLPNKKPEGGGRKIFFRDMYRALTCFLLVKNSKHEQDFVLQRIGSLLLDTCSSIFRNGYADHIFKALLKLDKFKRSWMVRFMIKSDSPLVIDGMRYRQYFLDPTKLLENTLPRQLWIDQGSPLALPLYVNKFKGCSRPKSHVKYFGKQDKMIYLTKDPTIVCPPCQCFSYTYIKHMFIRCRCTTFFIPENDH